MKTVVHYVIMPVQRGVESGGGLSAPGLVKVSDAAAVGDDGAEKIPDPMTCPCGSPAVGDDGAEKIPDPMTCPCGSPAVCVGPKGGRYCVTIDGKKRYR